MINNYAWTSTVTGATAGLTLIAASPAAQANLISDIHGTAPIAAEPRDRVRAALANGSGRFPSEAFSLFRIGGSRSESLHDLAIAVAVHELATAPDWTRLLDHIVFFAELGLDGTLRPGPSEVITTAVRAAANTGFRYAVVAASDDDRYLDTVDDITIITAATLGKVLDWLALLNTSEPGPIPTPRRTADQPTQQTRSTTLAQHVEALRTDRLL
ncbi:magnesium chelatase domain-containing protein [Nocardia ignorata]|uniref:magnesium chelatase domain-containing protein n=1 Tax=Nocardia ignorata TaxID=145285 RepID=UPI0036324B67